MSAKENAPKNPLKEARLDLALGMLSLLNQPSPSAEIIRRLLQEIQTFTGVEAVGLRLEKDGDFPYYETRGLSRTLVKAENRLIDPAGGNNSGCLQGLCGLVLSRRLPEKLKHVSSAGSFWTNDLEQSYAQADGKNAPEPFRGNCLREGYRSMALIPLKARKRVVGLLHLGDSRPERFDKQVIEFLEQVGKGIGAAVIRLGLEEKTADRHRLLQTEVERRTEELVRANEDLRKEIEERRRVEAELRESQVRYRALFRHSPFRTIIVDRDGQVTDFHPGTVEPGTEAVRSPQPGDRMYTKDFAGRHNVDMRRELMTAMESGQPKRFDDLTYEDRILSVIISPFAEGAIITSFDVTEQKRAEEEKKKFENQVLQAQKLEAVGTLAGGIAHDFNNILWIITGNTELAEVTLEKAHPAQHNLKRIEQASQRAKDLVAQILSFSRQSAQEKRPLKINAIVKESLKLMRASLPATIDIRQNIPSESPTVLADLSQINQVIVNLCTNAAHAMREKGGILDVSLVEINLDDDEEARRQGLGPGKYAILSVMDTGHGIAAEDLDRIFDPFYSTKQVDEGTGLGLSVTHGIVKDHGGTITVHSKPETGTTFHILLPILQEEKDPAPGASFDAIPKGSERVLFVDDDQGLLDMGETILRRLGYRVSATPSPMEALEWVRSRPDRFDLVITDQTMPRLTGEKLARELLKVRPNLPIILCTGYSELIDEEKAEKIGLRAFLLKPVVMDKLARTIRQVLDAPPS